MATAVVNICMYGSSCQVGVGGVGRVEYIIREQGVVEEEEENGFEGPLSCRTLKALCDMGDTLTAVLVIQER